MRELTAASKWTGFFAGDPKPSVNQSIITRNSAIEKPAILKAKGWIMRLAKVKDIDSPKGIFTDHRHAGGFIRPISEGPFLRYFQPISGTYSPPNPPKPQQIYNYLNRYL